MSETLKEGSQVGDYRIEVLLEQSPSANVYVATHVHHHNRVALKVPVRNLVARPAMAQRFLHEGRAAARVRHPHVIEIFDVGMAGKMPYIAMQLIEGESLAKRFARGPLPAEEIVGIMLPVLAAVATAHEQGVVHRDLNPQDIFLRRGDHGDIVPVVLNFGMSKLLGEASLPLPDRRSSDDIVIDLPFYLAPEQVHGGRDVRGATDQYSLAVVIYEGVTGRRPFQSDSLVDLVDKIVSGAYEPASTANPAVSTGLSNVIARAMAMGVNDRYTSLWAMGRALLKLASTRDRDRWATVYSQNP
jgi:eukaryotic-like serine/threonine-protein kinase